jgi:hypothetical protein
MCRRRRPHLELWGEGRLPIDADSSLGLSSEQMTRTMKNSKMINKRIPLKCPQWGKEQKHDGAYPPVRTTRQERGGD